MRCNFISFFKSRSTSLRSARARHRRLTKRRRQGRPGDWGGLSTPSTIYKYLCIPHNWSPWVLPLCPILSLCPRTNRMHSRRPIVRNTQVLVNCSNRTKGKYSRRPIVRNISVVYYKTIKREPKRRPTYEYRCDERLKPKVEGSTRLGYTGCRGER